VSLKDNVVAIPKNIVEFALHMNQECEKSSKKFYEEADKTPDLDIKIRSSQQGTIYSDMQILFGMMYVTMSSINSMGDKLANKEDVESLKTELPHKLKTELPHKLELYLGSLQREIDEWKRREGKADSIRL
jgi:hypothetical protein